MLLIGVFLLVMLFYLVVIGKLKRVYDKNTKKWIWTVEGQRQAYDRNHAIEKKLKALSLGVMRLQIHDEQLPVEERLEIGKDYMDSGGNGSTIVYLKKLQGEYSKSLGES